MKRINLISILLITQIQILSGQSTLSLLESAYIQFDENKNSLAIESFNEYFKTGGGSSTDYYFMAASLAKTGNIDKALKYSEKACYGIEILGMMLNDSEFELIHDSLQIKHNQLEAFHKFYNDHYADRSIEKYKKLDSLYNKLDWKLIGEAILYDIASQFSNNQDKTKEIYYLYEIIKNKTTSAITTANILRRLYNKKASNTSRKIIDDINSFQKFKRDYHFYTDRNERDSIKFLLLNLPKTPSFHNNQAAFMLSAIELSREGQNEHVGQFIYFQF